MANPSQKLAVSLHLAPQAQWEASESQSCGVSGRWTGIRVPQTQAVLTKPSWNFFNEGFLIFCMPLGQFPETLTGCFREQFSLVTVVLPGSALWNFSPFSREPPFPSGPKHSLFFFNSLVFNSLHTSGRFSIWHNLGAVE